MPSRLLTITALIVFTGATSLWALRPEAFEGPATNVWDGLYTRAQAERGKSLYMDYCESCHREDLSGFSTVPPLAGDTFIMSWSGRTVNDLYAYIRSGMPPYQSTAISRQAYIDIVTFILKTNGMPDGATELKPESSELKARISKRDEQERQAK